MKKADFFFKKKARQNFRPNTRTYCFFTHVFLRQIHRLAKIDCTKAVDNTVPRPQNEIDTITKTIAWRNLIIGDDFWITYDYVFESPANLSNLISEKKQNLVRFTVESSSLLLILSIINITYWKLCTNKLHRKTCEHRWANEQRL